MLRLTKQSKQSSCLLCAVWLLLQAMPSGEHGKNAAVPTEDIDPISLNPICVPCVLRPCGHRFELATIVRSLTRQVGSGAASAARPCPMCRARVVRAAALAAPNQELRGLDPVTVKFSHVNFDLNCTRASVPDPRAYLEQLFCLQPGTASVVCRGKRVAFEDLEAGATVMLLGTRVEEAEGGAVAGQEERSAIQSVVRSLTPRYETRARVYRALLDLWAALATLLHGIVLFFSSLLPSSPNRRAAGARVSREERHQLPPGYDAARPAPTAPPVEELGDIDRSAMGRFDADD